MLRPNQYVRARLSGAVRPNAIIVPQRAVQQRGDQFAVMRNDVFHTDDATAAAKARLQGRLDKNRLAEFEKQAAALSTPEQIATLEEKFRK